MRMDKAERGAHRAAEVINPDVRAWQRQLVRGALLSLVMVGPLALLAASYYAYVLRVLWLIPLYVTAYAAVCVVTFWRRIPYMVQVISFIALVYIVALSDFLQDGRGGSGRLLLLVIVSLAMLLLGRRGSVVVLGLGLLTLLGFGLAYSLGWLTLPPGQEVRSNDPSGWISNGVVFLMAAVLVLASQNYLVPRLSAALTQSQKLAQDLAAQRSNLEQLVADRTAALTRRARYLEATSDVARGISSVLEIHELLALVVNLIGERFEFYHVGLFFIDPTGQWATLQATSSGGGQRMLARGYRLRVGDQSLVGAVAVGGEPRMALDIDPGVELTGRVDLPDTHSEICLPLRARGEIFGVLDIQNRERAAFAEDDMSILQTLADQVALAISNARLFRQVEESMEAQRRAYGELSALAWQELVRAQPNLGFAKYGDVLTSVAEWDAEMVQAAESGLPVRGSAATLAVPIKSGEQVIAVLDAHLPESGVWTAERIALLQAISEQVAQAVERARLYQDTQQRAAREQLIGEVTGRIRETLDLNTVLQTAVRELGQALEVDVVEVRLGTAADNG